MSIVMLMFVSCLFAFNQADECINSGHVDYSDCYQRLKFGLAKADEDGSGYPGSKARCCTWIAFEDCVRQLVGKYCEPQKTDLAEMVIEDASLAMNEIEVDKLCPKFKTRFGCESGIIDALLAMLAVLVLLALFWWTTLRILLILQELEEIANEVMEAGFHFE